MLRLTTILVLLVLVVTVTPVAADTITFLDGTESVSVVTVGDRAHAFQSCDESSCGALLNAPAGAVNQISFFIVIGDPDGVTISDALVTTFNFVPPPLLSELIVTFVSDSDDPGGAGPCAADRTCGCLGAAVCRSPFDACSNAPAGRINCACPAC